jgi:hypothetical protein
VSKCGDIRSKEKSKQAYTHNLSFLGARSRNETFREVEGRGCSAALLLQRVLKVTCARGSVPERV